MFNVIVNLLTIPFFEQLVGNGAIGASVSTVLTEVFMLFGAMSLIPQHLLDARLIWQAGRIVVAGLASGIVGTAVLPVSLPLAAAAGAATYVVMAVVLRVLTTDDLQYVTNRLPRLSR